MAGKLYKELFEINEQLDEEPLTANETRQLFGYPPTAIMKRFGAGFVKTWFAMDARSIRGPRST